MANPYIGSFMSGLMQGYEFGEGMKERTALKEQRLYDRERQKKQDAMAEQEFGLRVEQMKSAASRDAKLNQLTDAQIAAQERAAAEQSATYGLYGGVEGYVKNKAAEEKAERERKRLVDDANIRQSNAAAAASSATTSLRKQEMDVLARKRQEEERGFNIFSAYVDAVVSPRADELISKLESGNLTPEEQLEAYQYLALPDLARRLGNEHKVSDLARNPSFKEQLSKVGEVSGDKIKIGGKEYPLSSLTAKIVDVPMVIPGMVKEGQINKFQGTTVIIPQLPGVKFDYDTLATEGAKTGDGSKVAVTTPEAMGARLEGVQTLRAAVKAIMERDPNASKEEIYRTVWENLTDKERAEIFIGATPQKTSPIRGGYTDEQYRRKQLLDNYIRNLDDETPLPSIEEQDRYIQEGGELGQGNNSGSDAAIDAEIAAVIKELESM